MLCLQAQLLTHTTESSSKPDVNMSSANSASAFPEPSVTPEGTMPTLMPSTLPEQTDPLQESQQTQQLAAPASLSGSDNALVLSGSTSQQQQPPSPVDSPKAASEAETDSLQYADSRAQHSSTCAKDALTDASQELSATHNAQSAHRQSQDAGHIAAVAPSVVLSRTHAEPQPAPVHHASVPEITHIKKEAAAEAKDKAMHLRDVDEKQGEGQRTPFAATARRNSLQFGDEHAPSSPIYGVAIPGAFSSPGAFSRPSACSNPSAFSSPDSAMSRTGSRDWLGHIFSGKKSSKKPSRKATNGSISPTRLFDGLATSASDAEHLFNSWHGPKSSA